MISIRTPVLRRLHRDWESRRAGRDFPARRDFDVLDLHYAIGRLALVDVEQSPSLRFRFRLHGTAISQRVGYDMTGKDLEDVPFPDVRAAIREHFTDVVGERKPAVRMRERQATGDGFISAEVLVLPLAQDGTTIDMLLIGVVFL
ncbi:MAG TPA: PAS domain-containing protein [Stellaceae bacterium]|nr:PAS domain-containing protein [Stellaceae bacterium]